jgi:hypothetical protein
LLTISGDLAMRSLFAMLILTATLVVAGCKGEDDTTTTTTGTGTGTDSTTTTTTTDDAANGATDNP